MKGFVYEVGYIIYYFTLVTATTTSLATMLLFLNIQTSGSIKTENFIFGAIYMIITTIIRDILVVSLLEAATYHHTQSYFIHTALYSVQASAIPYMGTLIILFLNVPPMDWVPLYTLFQLMFFEILMSNYLRDILFENSMGIYVLIPIFCIFLVTNVILMWTKSKLSVRFM